MTQVLTLTTTQKFPPQCEVWQTCTEDWQCTPDCVLDTHCDDTEYCDYPGWEPFFEI